MQNLRRMGASATLPSLGTQRRNPFVGASGLVNLAGVDAMAWRAKDYSGSGRWYSSDRRAVPGVLGSTEGDDSNDPLFLLPDGYVPGSAVGTQYQYVPGTASNALVMADNPLHRVIGDLDIQVEVALDSYASGVTQTLLSKYASATNQRAYILNLTPVGNLQLWLSTDGVIGLAAGTTTPIGASLDPKGRYWIRATYRLSDRRVQFFYGTDGVTWTQIGVNVVHPMTGIFPGTSSLSFGGNFANLADWCTGKLYRARVYNGIQDTGGTLVFDLDLVTPALTAPDKSRVWDQNGTRIVGGAFRLRYVLGDYASIATHTSNSITGDLDLRVDLQLDDYSNVNQHLAGKAGSYEFALGGTGSLILFANTVGGAVSVNVTPGVAFVDGSRYQVRVTRATATGIVQFFSRLLDTDPWVQIGANQTLGSGAIIANAQPLTIGAKGLAGNQTSGRYYRVHAVTTIGGATAYYDINFAGAPTNAFTFVESSPNAQTVIINGGVTINRSTTGRRMSVVERPLFMPATDDFVELGDQPDLNFGTDSFTIMFGVRNYAVTPGVSTVYAAKTGAFTQAGWSIRNGGNKRLVFRIHDGTLLTDISTNIDISNGLIQRYAFVRDVALLEARAYQDGVVATTALTAVGSVNNISSARLMRLSGAGAGNTDTEMFYFAAVRGVLSPAQQALLETELMANP